MGATERLYEDVIKTTTGEDDEGLTVAVYTMTKDFIKMADKAYDKGNITADQHLELTENKYEFLAEVEKRYPHLLNESKEI